MQYTKEQIEIMWKEFNGIQTTYNGNICKRWRNFAEGTSRVDVFDWFDKRYSGGLYALIKNCSS